MLSLKKSKGFRSGLPKFASKYVSPCVIDALKQKK